MAELDGFTHRLRAESRADSRQTLIVAFVKVERVSTIASTSIGVGTMEGVQSRKIHPSLEQRSRFVVSNRRLIGMIFAFLIERTAMCILDYLVFFPSCILSDVTAVVVAIPPRSDYQSFRLRAIHTQRSLKLIEASVC